jgi:hypothetical protein
MSSLASLGFSFNFDSKYDFAHAIKIQRVISSLYCMIWLLLVLAVQAKIDMQVGAGGFGFGCGSNSPAAQLPYSFVRLGPDTAPQFRK